MSIGPDTIDLWSWSLDLPLEHPEKAGLTVDEITRAGRFVFERDRHRFLVARAGLRRILARYLDQRPDRIAFVYNAFGKPRLHAPGGSGLRFNLSHSKALAVLAVSDCHEVGVDVEAIGRADDRVAQAYFSPAENLALNALPPSDRNLGFYRCWTCKEAFVKAQGCGLSIPLDSFDVTVSPATDPAIIRCSAEAGPETDWRLLSFALGSTFVGAVALKSARHNPALRWRDNHDAVASSLSVARRTFSMASAAASMPSSILRKATS